VLSGKKILVGVTGSIAIYKTLELIRLFIKQNASVKVLMSEEAKRFVTPLTFEAISQNRVLHVETENWADELNHIHIGKWADLFVIAPISANSINKIANGIADNLLTQSILAFNKTIVIAPSANTNMIENHITKESLDKLKKLGFIISEPQDKLLACLDSGKGAMSEPKDIFDICARELLKDDFWTNKDVVITGGGSVERIDDVRCISNFSSGKQANALAYAFYLKGANVTLISSKENNLSLIKTLHVESSQDYKKAIKNTIKPNSYLFMAAAISDFVPAVKKEGKIKKEEIGDSWNLELVKNEDILLNLDKKNIRTIGFKAELDEFSAKDNAKKMLEKKSLDAVCLNIIKQDNKFGSDKNEIVFLTKNNEFHLKIATKFDIAMQIVNLSKEL
jgi:phosphopantothenoylcysteine decarboxylase/phosphopantothenate--cysteine ligase